MRSCGLTACCVLAMACSSPKTDVQIVVYSPTDFGEDPDAELPSTVKLFVGMDESVVDASVAPEGFQRGEERNGAYWMFEYESESQPISPGDPAEFRFVLDERAELGIVVAVGYTQGRPTSSATLFHVKQQGGDFTRYPIGLNASADAKDPAMRTRFNQLALWGANDQTCVHVENLRDDVYDEGHRTAFLVRDAKDLDCDGLQDGDPLECAPTVYMGSRPPVVDELSCTSSSGGCRLGGAGCVDGRGAAPASCDPSRYCAPRAICNACAANNDFNCARDLQAQAVLDGLALVCDVYAPHSEGASGIDARLCETSSFVAIPTGGRQCEAVAGVVRDGNFDHTLRWDSQEIELKLNDCKLELRPKGELGSANVVRHGALLTFDLEGGRGLAIPMVVKITPMAVSAADPSTACDKLAPVCRLVGTDLPTDVASCLAADPP
ncbi:MAG: hypothetical protein SFX73_20170 [Kofleriaceae bacterium]|nr:hypothetical protein [Kofleriaceae bacterium]